MDSKIYPENIFRNTETHEFKRQSIYRLLIQIHVHVKKDGDYYTESNYTPSPLLWNKTDGANKQYCYLCSLFWK
jgi:hypothetical protein